MRRVSSRFVASLVLMACAACGGASPAPARSTAPGNPAAFTPGRPYRPQIRASDFVRTIDNPYHPLIPGTVRRYEGTSDGEKETNVITVTKRTRTILGIRATVVRDTVYDADGKLAEDTLDWFAQDRDGNVWYLGEDSREYKAGKMVSTEGSWEAGKRGAFPGIVMLASPRVRDRYQQEYGKGVAEDRAKVVALHESVKVPFGSYDDVIVIEESTPLEPDLVERKYYARGIGVVLERLISGGQEISRLVDVRPKPKP